MKTTLLLLGLTISLSAMAQEKRIELQTIVSSTTTNYSDGTSKSSSPSYTLKWRYEGEGAWKNTGRRYKNIAPALNKYESSAALLQKTKNIDLYGKGSGWLIMGGGLTMAIIGFTTQKEVETYQEWDGQTVTEYQDRRTLGWIGLGVFAAGYYVRWGSVQVSMKRFGQACEEYNKMVDGDRNTGSTGQIDFGLQGSSFSPYPMMNVKLSF